ncbi:hypothetical protein [Hyalangium versicolor]|nr:hypothetical protein [Hyalangium versicolor]
MSAPWGAVTVRLVSSEQQGLRQFGGSFTSLNFSLSVPDVCH